MTKTIKFSENVYTTVCPGCGFGCGVYLRELMPEGENHILNIDYRKPSPVNEGKLCRFGVKLPEYFEQTEYNSDSFETGLNEKHMEAIKKAADALKGVKSSEIALVSAGNTTNEEHMAFINLGKTLNTPVNTCVNHVYKDIGKLHVYTSGNVSYSEIENAKKIYLFVNPYVSYPLITRRLVHAKRKGAEIVYFGLKKLPIACKNVKTKPCESLYEVDEFKPDSETVIISDITPYTNSKRISEIVEIANPEKTEAKLLFMKPFVNSTGAGHLSRHSKQKTIQNIIKGIEDGTIRVLFCLDTDIINMCLNPEVENVLKKVETLIVMSSTKTPICEIADVLIETEPFYKKEGTVVNSERRIIPMSSTLDNPIRAGFNQINEIIKAVGGNAKSFEDTKEEILLEFGIEKVDEFKIPEVSIKKYDVEKVSDKLEVCCPADEPDTNAKFIYELNPFMWHNRKDENDYIEISPEFISEIKLIKGHTADINCACKSINKTLRYKPTDMENGYIFSQKKQPFAKAPVAKVNIKPTPLVKKQ